MGGLEPPTSASQTQRASICATPRRIEYNRNSHKQSRKTVIHRSISRRSFLKKSFTSCASLGLWGVGLYSEGNVPPTLSNGLKLGRVLVNSLSTYLTPNGEMATQDRYAFDEVITYTNAMVWKNPNNTRELWLALEDGSYVRGKHIQLVEYRLNEIKKKISRTGQLAEITVPFTEAISRKTNHINNHKPQHFYYGSTHWVYGLGMDRDGNYFYRVLEDRWGDEYYIDATHAHIYEDSEISADEGIDQSTTEKVIEIDLKNQFLIARENGQTAFTSVISSGYKDDELDLSTPTGEFEITYKRPSRHMVHTEEIGINDLELYGVPWVMYFDENGNAIHGTYWHNDFGARLSHGCVNVPIAGARWLYLWTLPVVPPREKKFVSRSGTRIEIR